MTEPVADDRRVGTRRRRRPGARPLGGGLRARRAAAQTLRNWAGLLPVLRLPRPVPRRADGRRLHARRSSPRRRGPGRRCGRRSTSPFRELLRRVDQAVGGVGRSSAALIGILLALVVVRLQRPALAAHRRLGVLRASPPTWAASSWPSCSSPSLGAPGSGHEDPQDRRRRPRQPTFITSFWGLVVVYLFFQIPLMFLVMLPAVDGLKPAWREAVSNLGGTLVHLLAAGRDPGARPGRARRHCCCCSPTPSPPTPRPSPSPPRPAQLVSVQIRFYLQGNVIAGAGQRRLRAGGVDDRDHAGDDRAVPAAAPPGRTVAAMTTAISGHRARRRARRPRARHAVPPAGGATRGSVASRVASWLFLLAPARLLHLPVLRDLPVLVPAGAHGAARRAATLFEPVDVERHVGRRLRDPQFGHSAVAVDAKLAVGAIVLTLGLMLPDGDVGAPAGPVGPRARRDAHRAAVRGAADRARRRRDRRLPATPRRGSSAAATCSIPFYAVLAMPFTYRSLDAGLRAIDLRTLVDASRSLGAGWGTTMFRVLVPEHAGGPAHVGVPHRHGRAR